MHTRVLYINEGFFYLFSLKLDKTAFSWYYAEKRKPMNRNSNRKGSLKRAAAGVIAAVEILANGPMRAVESILQVATDGTRPLKRGFHYCERQSG